MVCCDREPRSRLLRVWALRPQGHRPRHRRWAQLRRSRCHAGEQHRRRRAWASSCRRRQLPICRDQVRPCHRRERSSSSSTGRGRRRAPCRRTNPRTRRRSIAKCGRPLSSPASSRCRARSCRAWPTSQGRPPALTPRMSSCKRRSSSVRILVSRSYAGTMSLRWKTRFTPSWNSRGWRLSTRRCVASEMPRRPPRSRKPPQPPQPAPRCRQPRWRPGRPRRDPSSCWLTSRRRALGSRSALPKSRQPTWRWCRA
mmetsp:Transcript_10635/g.43968  ORF Transcript_10635/g.43968 Transcript_10635/m.43968 type:complete len:255 (-) Transcript_10635:2490-3254(-)